MDGRGNDDGTKVKGMTCRRAMIRRWLGILAQRFLALPLRILKNKAESCHRGARNDNAKLDDKAGEKE
jgi:hypothetical protein